MGSMRSSTTLYPLFLSLRGLKCLIVGLGQVGRRKLTDLLRCDPSLVLALDTAEPGPEACALLDDPRVRFARRSCGEGDLNGMALAFAATSDPGENSRIAAMCRARGIWCNCASTPAESSFLVPAVARSSPLAAALSTSGTSPALARRWKQELQQWLEPRSRMAALMGRLRPLILALPGEKGHTTALFRRLAVSPLQDLLTKEDREGCRRVLEAELPFSLHCRIAEVLDDLP